MDSCSRSSDLSCLSYRAISFSASRTRPLNSPITRLMLPAVCLDCATPRPLSAMFSRLKMLRSMSCMSSSCRCISCEYRSVIRWISFFIPAMSSPVSSSWLYAVCVSFSSSILRSSNMICRSCSSTSLSNSSLSSLIDTICCSSRMASSSWSRSRCANSVSTVKLESSSAARSCAFCAMSVLSRDMSACMAEIPISRSFTSTSSFFTVPSNRMRFWLSTACLDRISPTLSLTALASFCECTRSVCNFIHCPCSAPHVCFLASISLPKLRIVASNGPTSAFSAPTCSANRCLIVSNLRFSPSRSLIFFSSSSVRRRISSSYLAMSCSLRFNSASTSRSVFTSCSLCAIVLRLSTLMRASSFCTWAMSFSLRWISCRIFSVALATCILSFSSVVWSLRLRKMVDSTSCVSWATSTMARSILMLSSCTSFCSCPTRENSASVVSRDFLSMVYCSLSRARCSRMDSTCRSRKLASFRTFVTIPTSFSFFSSSPRMLVL
mmetsp:Transcript_66856/g.157750  ORF Transcript_66856/g.157750 Transcript_66856/m.157750 type:complete len:494 (+) Transcript_66856:352-1833(+)